MRLLIIAGLLLASQAFAGSLPDPILTPGEINPLVTQENIDSTICKKGWSKTIRPPTWFTNKLKKVQLVQYGFDDKTPGHYEEDHFISLTLGGSPRSPLNLWPQAYAGEWGAKKKDRLELLLNQKVCNGELTLEDAQTAMRTNWIEAFKKYIQ